jgi:Holliday junction DNA helicase RuvA
MIRRISGRLEGVEASAQPAAIVAPEQSGLAYEVLIPRYLADRWEQAWHEPGGPRGTIVTLHTREVFESVNQGASFVPRLLGFERAEHRGLFDLLVGVKGLGPRRGLRAMAIEPAALAAAIAGRDIRTLQSLPEIGKKLAESIATELAEKVLGVLGEAERAGLEAAASGGTGRTLEAKPGVGTGRLGAEGEHAARTLEALGETRSEAERRVRAAMDTLGAAATADALVAAAFGAPPATTPATTPEAATDETPAPKPGPRGAGARKKTATRRPGTARGG